MMWTKNPVRDCCLPGELNVRALATPVDVTCAPNATRRTYFGVSDRRAQPRIALAVS
jgi:hypothetical protein